MTKVVTRTATCTAFRGVETSTGVLLSGPEVAARVGWLADLVAGVGQKVLNERWNATDFDLLNAPTLPSGARMPAFAYKALGMLHGWERPPVGVCASSRVVRMGMELAGRQLRSAQYRRAAVAEVIAGIQMDVATTDAVTWRNTRRQVGNYVNEHGRVPADLFELAPEPPRLPRQVPLAASDTQFSAYDRSIDGMLGVELLLPLTARPASKADWSLVRLEVTIPATYQHGVAKAVTLRPAGDRVFVDVPVELPVAPPSGLDGVVFGLDWGVRRLLSGAVAHRVDGAVVTDGRAMYFDPTGLMVKVHRLRVHREKNLSGVARLDRLLAKRPGVALQARRDLMQCEADRLDRKQTALSKQTAQLAAQWAVQQALAAGASVIAVEDLKSMEHRGHGKRNNTRGTFATRGLTRTAIENLAVMHGIKVVDVPARGTSSGCPRCDRQVTHLTAPNGAAGHAWARCACGWSADRDHSAAIRIAARGVNRVTKGGVQHKKVRVRRSKRTSLTDLGRSHASPRRPSRDKNGPTSRRPKEGRRAGRVVTPPQPHLTTAHRWVGPEPKEPAGQTAGAQVRTTRTDRPFEGTRWAYRARLRATPVLYGSRSLTGITTPYGNHQF